MTGDVALAVAIVVLVALYVTWTAGRLDRMHARVDAAWAGLDAQLVRRAAAARSLLPHLPPGAEAAAVDERAIAALAAGEHGREAVENALTRALRAAVGRLPRTPAAEVALTELDAASTRVGLARSFHNSAVTDTRALRRRRLPRLLRLAGHRAMPSFFDVDDTAILPPW
ncbi:MAG TPA: NUDIX hydrolase [Mycobacteriales bacterium]|nr:NUDIX hydrolase [Mycobacteriales bacterium]